MFKASGTGNPDRRNPALPACLVHHVPTVESLSNFDKLVVRRFRFHWLALKIFLPAVLAPNPLNVRNGGERGIQPGPLLVFTVSDDIKPV